MGYRRFVARRLRAVARSGVAAVGALVLAAGGALLVTGCGASHAISQALDPVARAAEVTAKVPGYRMLATVEINTGATTAHGTMSGIFDRRARTGAITTAETVGGHSVRITEKFSGLTFYMSSSGLPGATKLAGGRPWLRFDVGPELSAMGLGGLPTEGTDPSQFVDYLRGEGGHAQRVGSETVGGVPTTHYHVTVDLDRYAQLVPAAGRARAKQSVARLESTIGAHTIPMDAWIDARHLVRRIRMSFSECVQTHHLHLAMTMNLFGYGAEPQVTMPSASQTRDLTPLIRAAAARVKLGCAAP